MLLAKWSGSTWWGTEEDGYGDAGVQHLDRIDAEEFYRILEGVVIDDAQVFNDKLQEWEDFYNYHRPHGSLDGQTPYERLKQRTQARV